MAAIRQLVVVELVALAALLFAAGAVAAYGAVDSASHPNSIVDPAGSAWVGFAYTLGLGAPTVVLLGAPAYLLLLRAGSLNWLRVTALGAAPGVLLVFLAGGVGVIATVCGIFVASATHLVCRRLGPNNSCMDSPCN